MSKPSGGIGTDAGVVDACQRVALALGTTAPRDEVLGVVADVARALTGAGRCSVWLAGPDGPQVAASSGPIDRGAAEAAMTTLPEDERPFIVHHGRLRETGGPPRPELAVSGVIAVAPPGGERGAVVVDWWDPPSAADEGALLSVLALVASWVGVALETTALRAAAAEANRREHRRALAAAARRSALRARTAANLARRLDELLVVDGIRVIGVAVRDQVLRRALLADGLVPAERQAWRSGRDPVALGEGVVGVPVVAASRLVASLRVRPRQGLTPGVRALLAELAPAVADAFDRSRLALAAELAAEERDAVADRSWLVRDAVVDAVDVLSALEAVHPGGRRSDEAAEHLARLATHARGAVADAMAASEWMPAPDQRLLPALRALVTLARRRGGLDVVLRVVGEPRWLAPASERLLYRAAYETVLTAWHHARGAMVRLELVYGESTVALAVTDDGAGPGHRGRQRGFPRLRRLVTAAGGTMTVAEARDVPRGVSVEVELPAGRPPLRRHL